MYQRILVAIYVTDMYTTDIYHLLNRGVEKRNIFLEDGDYIRFVHSLFAFNTDKRVNNMKYHASKNKDLRGPYSGKRPNQLVTIHGWCLMKNHYHLLVSEQCEGGISKFLLKLNVGYAKYFNEKYSRSGTLFQGRTKKILIEQDAHLMYILHYIHLNPLDYTENNSWRTYDISDIQAAITYLQTYRWSSYLDYAGTRNFPSILNTSLFNELYDGNYITALQTYIKNIRKETSVYDNDSHKYLE